MESKPFDYIIIGGGPIGLYAALELKVAGFQVAVFEKKIFPIDKVCGEGIMPLGRKLLKRHNVVFSSEFSYSFSGIEFKDQDQLSATLDFKVGSGLGVRRLELSQKLKEMVETNNIMLTESSEYISHEETGDLVSVKIKINNEFRNFRTKYLVAADGIHSKVRNQLQAPLKKFPFSRIGLRWHLPITPWSPNVQVFWSKGIEAYVTPVGENLVEIAILSFKSCFEGQKIEEILDHFPELKSIINGEAPLDKRGYGPFPIEMKQNVHGRVIFIGDAFAFIDGITGDGLSFGFLQGHLLAMNAYCLEDYVKKVRNYFRLYKLITFSTLMLSYFPMIRKIFLSKASRFILTKVFRFHVEHGLPFLRNSRPGSEVKQLSLT
ncbi:MAG: NAD(P)/FAD-dependent oxidoreductase [Bdellovibrio sp.]